MTDESGPEEKERHTRKGRVDSETSGKEGNKESNTVEGLLMLGTLGFFGSLLWMACQKTISPMKKPEPEVPPEEESVEELARRLRELLASPPPEGEEEIRRMKQKEILEKLQSRMKPEDWPLVEEILRKPRSPQGQ
jgi:hypothetical protein